MKLAVVGATRRVRGLPARLKLLAARFSEEMGLPRCEATLMLAGDDEIRALNRRFLGKNEPTDVLSFPSGAEPAAAARYLGDLAISLDRAAEQGREHGHGAAEEAEVLLLHGLLHLLGHDHETDGGRMRRLESRLAKSLLGGTRGLIGRAGRAAERSRTPKGRASVRRS